MNLLTQRPVDLNIAQIQTLIRGMYQVALTDGIHHTELVMMKDFYQLCAQEAGAIASFEDLVETDFDPETATHLLHSDALRQTFVTSCILLAYADGRYSDRERAKVMELGQAIGWTVEQIRETEDLVADQLMAPLAHIENVEALKEIAQELHHED